jgi:hypothetical protein
MPDFATPLTLTSDSSAPHSSRIHVTEKTFTNRSYQLAIPLQQMAKATSLNRLMWTVTEDLTIMTCFFNLFNKN